MKPILTLLLIIALLHTVLYSTAQMQHPVVITYAGGYNGRLIAAERIKARQLTHLLYAFADLKHNKVFLHFPETDAINLKRLTKLRTQNPALKIMLSVGGLGWSRNFSDMALTESSRQTFAQSCLELLRQYNLDGIDIDWEFPGYAGEGGNIYRSADKQNYTLLFKTLRSAFEATQRHYIITAAVDGWASHFLPHTEMAEVQKYTDYICLMTYNFTAAGQSGGHFLYSPAGWNKDGSADGAIKAFMQAGVPANKLVLGAGFFPAAFRMQTANPYNRYYQSRLSFRGGLAKVYSLISRDGFTHYWDDEGKAPYLFNTASRIKIAYEDAASVKAKCDYVTTHELAGIMYWDYFSDPGRKLLETISQSFRQ